MKSIKILGTVLALSMAVAVPGLAQEEKPAPEEKPQPAERPAPERPQQEQKPEPQPEQPQAKPHQQEEKRDQQEQKQEQKDNKQAQKDQQKNEKSDAKNMKQEQVQRGGRIPDDQFRAHFGRQHTFHINRPVIVEGSPRFQYGGYTFVMVDPWPTGWSYSDAVYVDFIDGVYYLCDPLYPGVQLMITVLG